MDWSWIWKAILVLFVGTFLLRLAGRKSISQMTLAQTVIMISIGSLLIQPVSGSNVWVTFGVAALMIFTLLFLEFAQIKFDIFENMITGKAKVVIENGIPHESNLKKLRLTVDQLETRLRQENISKISDVRWATLEPSGQMGVELKETAKYATKGDIQKLLNYIQSVTASSEGSNPAVDNDYNIFDEVPMEEHTDPPPEHMQ
ncbi:DUF421 domain-containing protein [Paludifilum halophilum]|uniref:DUF421 domain-containing protein n=1 Tax=Paludifilum halophilum TaxID=1642702 RepID=A0A235BBY1_9BACL|nr:DUF421 domain-containing protein [Paludifilum halophilum]OYD09793.1 DUF421 domain-containing protein [Paludifilum halophilum]